MGRLVLTGAQSLPMIGVTAFYRSTVNRPMRASTYAPLCSLFGSLLIAGLLALPALAQPDQPAFRPATWGMTPSDVQSMEPGTPLADGRQAAARGGLASLDHVEAYMDVIRGKVGKIVYGFADEQLVYSAFHFRLKERDRAFSQRIGTHLRTRYGASQHVDASESGRTIRLYWSTSHTKVIGQFAPDLLQVQFWDAEHWAQRTAGTALTDHRDE